MNRKRSEEKFLRLLKASWTTLLATVLISAPHACRPASVDGAVRLSGRPTACWRRARGGPFDYIDEADRQRGRPAPGQQVVRLESRDGKYHYYRVNTGGYVRVYRQLSSGPCRQGEDWGYDRRGIWVNHGCRAEFVVGQPDVRPVEDRPPSWAIGTFRGHDSERDADVSLTIDPNGRVRLRSDFRGKRPTVNRSGSYQDGRLRFEGATLELDRAGDGVRTTETGGRHSRIRFQRVD